MRAHRPYQLSQKLETVLHHKAVAGRAAWTRLFDETMAGLRVRIDGRALALEEAFDRLTDADGAVRKRAGKALGRVLARNVRTLALITNTLAKDKAIEDDLRGYPDPATSRHVSNQVEGRVVEALVDAVTAAYPALSHRYYRLKAGWLKKHKLEYWDRSAPLPEAGERRYRWDEAVELVLDSYARFSPGDGHDRAPLLRQPLDRRPGCGRARRRARSPIPPCRASTPTCCSTTSASRAT